MYAHTYCLYLFVHVFTSYLLIHIASRKRRALAPLTSLSSAGPGWSPQDSVQLRYEWLKYGLWMFMVDITIVDGVFRPTNISGGHHPV